MFSALMLLAASCAALPVGSEPAPVAFPHFPDKVHAFVWRNWQLVPAQRMGEVIGATPDQIVEMGNSMGLAAPGEITRDQLMRSYITIIRRNWHLLPYEQLLQLLGWTEDELAFTLQEDDFLYVKLGLLKPKCEPLHYSLPDESVKAREAEIRNLVLEKLGDQVGKQEEPLFEFVLDLSAPPAARPARDSGKNLFSPRYCSSYFALYGDPLLDRNTSPYPDGYLARLADSGANGVWLQAVLYKLHPFPWAPEMSDQYEKRLENLRDLVARAKAQGIGIYLYLNEPRSMPPAFFEKHPEVKGVNEGERTAMCTSTPEVRAYIREAVQAICTAVPDLAGFFTITASENLTSCWSHGQGAACERCKPRGPAAVIAELNATIQEGLDAANTGTRLIAWDWGWGDDWAPEAIKLLPKKVALMSVSEWSLPIERGGVKSAIGEYSISAIGPGPRATKHWGIASESGLDTIAKIQAGNTWELSAVPYIPAVARVAQHASNLRGASVDGIMLGWSLGGYPSPNLDAVKVMGATGDAPTVDAALARVAEERVKEPFYREELVRAWKQMSESFGEFPYSGSTVYNAPLQMGPANLLWGTPTGYRATMVGIPYDDLDAWRGIYPPEIFAAQLEKVAGGFRAGVETLHNAVYESSVIGQEPDRAAMDSEIRVAQACAIHMQSVANQTRFVMARNALAGAAGDDEKSRLWTQMAALLEAEAILAKDLYGIQSKDSRIGFEASNQYFYVPVDLAEKVINCADLLSEMKKQ